MDNEMNGLGDLGYAMDAYAPIDDLAEDYDFFGLEMVNVETLKKGLMAAAAGGGGILVVANVMDRIDYFADKPKYRAGAEIAIGILGGALLWRVSPEAGIGFAGGVSGMGAYSLVSQYMAESQAGETTADGLAYTGVNRVPSYLTRGRVSVPRGLARDMVTRANYEQIHGLEDGEINGDVGHWVS